MKRNTSSKKASLFSELATATYFSKLLEQMDFLVAGKCKPTKKMEIERRKIKVWGSDYLVEKGDEDVDGQGVPNVVFPLGIDTSQVVIFGNEVLEVLQLQGPKIADGVKLGGDAGLDMVVFGRPTKN